MTGALEILLVGDPRLRAVARPVADADLAPALRLGADMACTLAAFRAQHGWGRAIAAPQVGAALRLVAFDFGNGPFLALNPRITWRSADIAVVCDDCFSLPGIAAPVERHVSVTLTYEDERRQSHILDGLPFELAELVQHELDHLDGILFVDRITEARSIVARVHKPRVGGN